MTTCRLTVRAREGVWQAEADPWTSLVVLASLSAEPESLGELAAAARRYLPEHRMFEPVRPASPPSPPPSRGGWGGGGCGRSVWSEHRSGRGSGLRPGPAPYPFRTSSIVTTRCS
ncbi:MAG TPA: hypothetical protein VIL46_13255 [Gemmataceae bacterium]